MIIENLRKEEADGTARVLATVRFEDSDRPSREIYFEVESARAEGFREDANAMLTGCYLPAIRAGERRVRLEGPVCPKLCDGLAVGAALLRGWYGGNRNAIPVESRRGLRAPVPRSPANAAFFLTGGIDSLALLHRNRGHYAPSHPAAFRDAIAVFGLTIPDQVQSAFARDQAARTVSVLEEILQGMGIRLVPVTTNLAALAPDLAFLELEFISSALISAAHNFPGRWSTLSIASGRDIANLFPQGTHPLLDGCFGTAAIDVRHEGLRDFRLAKLRSIAGWSAGVDNLIVCMHTVEPPWLNCGKCEKCVRTMVQLLAIGKLSTSRRFPRRDVTVGMIESLPPDSGFKRAWAEILPDLGARGRDDLIAAIQRKLDQTRRLAVWLADRGLKGRFRRIDRRLLGGTVLRSFRALRARRSRRESLQARFEG